MLGRAGLCACHDDPVTNVLVVHASPSPGSFSHALAEAATSVWRERGAEVEMHDLYAEGFQPIAPTPEAVTVGSDVEAVLAAEPDPLLRAHREALVRADHLIVAHPNWWGMPPAIMAGWVDRVMVPGVAYRLESAEGLPTTLLHLHSLLVLNTGDTAPEREATVFGDPLDSIWRRCVGTYLGDATVARLLAGPVAGSSEEQRQAWLAEARELAASL